MKNIVLLTVLTTMLFSCTSQEEKNKQQAEKYKQQEDQQKQQQENEKKKIISNLVAKYNILYKWDTLHYRYSINYKPVIESRYQLIDHIEIIDIYEKDSSQYVSLRTGSYPSSFGEIQFLDLRFHDTFDLLGGYRSFYFNLLISKEQISKMTRSDGDLILIVSVSDIIKNKKLSLTGKMDDANYSLINLETTPEFIGNGKIIDIVSFTFKK